MWKIHGDGDKTETTDMFMPDMRAVSYEQALGQADPKIATEINSTTWQTRWDACQNGLANVRKALIDADPDVLVVFAADLAALFLDDDMAAVAVFTDDTIVNVPRPMTADTSHRLLNIHIALRTTDILYLPKRAFRKSQ